MDDNNLLTALALIERVEPQIKSEKRDQIDRNTLSSIQKFVGMALERMQGIKLYNDLVKFYFVDALSLIDALLDDDNFNETDTETKQRIAQQIRSGLDLLYIEVGRYYDKDHEFTYSNRLDDLLQRVINKCLKEGIYFGHEV
jgi:hypothetical protein